MLSLCRTKVDLLAVFVALFASIFFLLGAEELFDVSFEFYYENMSELSTPIGKSYPR
jgi:hypothetical protein